MLKNYEVSGVATVNCDYCKHFTVKVVAQSPRDAVREAKKKLHLSRGYLVRDLTVIETE